MATDYLQFYSIFVHIHIVIVCRLRKKVGGENDKSNLAIPKSTSETTLGKIANRNDKPRIGLQKATSAIIFSKIGGANGKSMLGEQKANSGIKDGKARGGKNKKKLASQKETSKTLFRKIGEGDDEPRLGIQKATAGILAAFKHIETKVKYENGVNTHTIMIAIICSQCKSTLFKFQTKIDIQVDDGANIISRTSYVFPSRLLHNRPVTATLNNTPPILQSGKQPYNDNQCNLWHGLCMYV